MRSHLVDDRRLLGTAVSGMVVGAIFAVLFAVVVSHEFEAGVDTSGPNYFVGGLGAVALLLPLSIVRLVQMLLRRGQTFVLHENGFIRRTRRGDEVVRWADVADVRHFGKERNGGLWHGLALDYRCRIRCSDGRKLRLNTMVDDAEWFARSVATHVQEFRANR